MHLLALSEVIQRLAAMVQWGHLFHAGSVKTKAGTEMHELTDLFSRRQITSFQPADKCDVKCYSSKNGNRAF
jgi:hypothetical protein